MQSTRRELVDELLDFVGETNDSGALATAQTILNRVLLSLWLRHPWSAFVAPTPYQFTSVASQRSYPLPSYFGRPQQDVVARNITTGRQIFFRDQSAVLQQDPAAGTTLETAGEPECYYIAGVAGVSTQPSTTGDALELVSSDPADTDVRVSLEGRDASGVELRSQVTLNGTTVVAAGTWSAIEEYSKGYLEGTTAPTTGTSSRGSVTLRKSGGGTTLETLLADESARQHTLVTLYRMPSSAWSFAIPYIRAPRKMLYDGDAAPQFWGPALFEELLIQWQMNSGELNAAQAAQMPRPAYLDLIAEDNRTRRRPRTRPYSRP